MRAMRPHGKVFIAYRVGWREFSLEKDLFECCQQITLRWGGGSSWGPGNHGDTGQWQVLPHASTRPGREGSGGRQGQWLQIALCDGGKGSQPRLQSNTYSLRHFHIPSWSTRPPAAEASMWMADLGRSCRALPRSCILVGRWRCRSQTAGRPLLWALSPRWHGPAHGQGHLCSSPAPERWRGRARGSLCGSGPHE